MRKYRSEQQVLDALQIPDWRHMSKDKIMGFASQHRKDMLNHFLAICATISVISASAAAAIGAATALKNNDTPNDI